MTTTHTAFVGVSPGLEPVLVDELTELGLTVGRRSLRTGGVEVRVTGDELVRVVRRSHIAAGVRVRVARRDAVTTFEELARVVERAPWAAYFPRGATPRVVARCKRSRLYHSDAVAERVAAAIARRLAQSGAPEHTPASVVHVRLRRDQLTLSVDAVGGHLYERGWRVHVGDAPLRETWAAALVRLAGGHRPGTAVVDPFCGAGTIPIAAARMQAGLPPSLESRSFAFETWPTLVEVGAGAGADAEGADDAADDVASGAGSAATAADVGDAACVWGSDVDGVLAAARENATAAGVDARIAWRRAPAADAVAEACTSMPRPRVVVTNPPWGVRLAAEAMPAVAADDWDGAAVLLASDIGPPPGGRGSGPPWVVLARFRVGGVPASVWGWTGESVDGIGERH